MEELTEETLSRITGHVLESIWAHLEQEGLAGFPERIGSEAHDSGRLTGDRIANLEAKVAELSGGGAGAPSGDLEERLAALEQQVATLGKSPNLGAKIDDLLEEKVDDLDLESLRDRVLASVRSRLGDSAPAATAAPPAPDLTQVKAELKAELQAELSSAAPAATESTVSSSGGSMTREELLKVLDLEKIARRLEHMAIHPVLKAIDERMKAANLSSVAEEAAEKAISKRFSSDVLEQVSNQGQISGTGDVNDKLEELEARLMAKVEEQASMAGSPGGMLQDESGEPIKLTEDRHFLALAREVKTLRDSLNLVEMFNSREFKEIFDRRINQVISYMRNDAIPSAVKKAMQQA